jgi:hypothetical protein
VTAPSRATIAGQAYLDLRRKARQDRRPVDQLIQLSEKRTENGVARMPGGGEAAWFKDSEGNLVGVVPS